MYLGGTIPSVKEGAIGHLDTTSPVSLKFESPNGNVETPLAKMDSYIYSQEVSHHLGVLAAIAVGLVRKRQRRHFFRITFRDESDAPQVAVFEVPKRMPMTLMTILLARGPHGCRRSPMCGQEWSASPGRNRGM